MAASNISTIPYIFKRVYAGRKTPDLAMRDHPTATMMRKEGGFGGSAYFYDTTFGNPQGLSGTFASAQAAASPSKGVQWQASRKKKFGIITLDGEAMAASEGDDAAFFKLVTRECSAIIEEHGDDLAFQLHRDGNGYHGIVGSINSNTVTLTVPDDARNFKVGMTVVADDTITGASLRDSGNSTTVTGVDEDVGTITLASVAAISGLAPADYLFRVGDPATIVDGFDVIIPLTAPVLGVDSFRGVDRGQHVRLLSGVRINDTATSIEENLGLAAVKISQSHKRAATQGKLIAPLNPINFWAVCRRMNAKRTYVDAMGKEAAFGFESFDIHTPAGTVKAISDPDAPINRGRILNMADWYWKTLKDWVHVITDDKNGPLMRVYNDDSVEMRTRSMGNPCTDAPGGNATTAI